MGRLVVEGRLGRLGCLGWFSFFPFSISFSILLQAMGSYILVYMYCQHVHLLVGSLGVQG